MAKYGFVTCSMTATTAAYHSTQDISHLRHIQAQMVQSSSESASALSCRLELSLDGTNYTRVASFEIANSADLASVQAWLTLSFPGAGADFQGRFFRARITKVDGSAGAVKVIISGENVNEP